MNFERLLWELPPETLVEIRQLVEDVIKKRGILHDNNYAVKIRYTHLSARAKNVLIDHGITTIADLLTLNPEHVQKWRNCGPNTSREILNYYRQVCKIPEPKKDDKKQFDPIKEFQKNCKHPSYVTGGEYSKCSVCGKPWA